MPSKQPIFEVSNPPELDYNSILPNFSWKNSREGLSEDTNEGRPLLIEDIKKDAERIRKRREMLNGILGAIENRKREYGLKEGFEGRY